MIYLGMHLQWIMKKTKEIFEHMFISKVLRNSTGYIVVIYCI